MTVTSLTKQPGPRGLAMLEWSVAAGSLLLGSVVVLAGVNYGLTNVTGVGAGFFPVVAGILDRGRPVLCGCCSWRWRAGRVPR